MIAVLAPPGDGEIVEVIAIVGDNDSGFPKREQKLFFVAQSAITGRHSCQAIDSVSDEKWCQQDVIVFIQIDAKWYGRH